MKNSFKKIAFALACVSGLGGKTLAMKKNQSQNAKPPVTVSKQINENSNKGVLSWVKNHKWQLGVGGSLTAALATVLTVLGVKYLGKNDEAQDLNNQKDKGPKQNNNSSKLNNDEKNDENIKNFENKTRKEEIQGKTFYELLKAKADEDKIKGNNAAKELLDALYAFLDKLGNLEYVNTKGKNIPPLFFEQFNMAGILIDDKIITDKNSSIEAYDEKHIFELLDFLSGKQKISNPDNDFYFEFKKDGQDSAAALTITVNHTDAKDDYEYQFINVKKSYVHGQISIEYSPDYNKGIVFKFNYPFETV